ncbi:MAG: ExbD/TolR family protein [Cardiobacteriaceae bacterium]|nr:ExbD/TolR family protein [Cardiobacteriaceae bacterium]
MIRRRRHKLKAEMNVVPYIDVMLVLLVIFMIAAPLIQQQSIEIDLPDNKTELLDMPENVGSDVLPLILTVDVNGNYYLNRGETTQALIEEDVINLAQEALKEHPDLPVLVQGDKGATYDKVIDGIVLLQQAGAPKVGLVTEEPQEKTTEAAEAQ